MAATIDQQLRERALLNLRRGLATSGAFDEAQAEALTGLVRVVLAQVDYRFDSIDKELRLLNEKLDALLATHPWGQDADSR